MRGRIAALAISLLAVSACTAAVDPGSVRIEGPSVTIGQSHSADYGAGRSGRFCPPGQAKKGRC